VKIPPSALCALNSVSFTKILFTEYPVIPFFATATGQHLPTNGVQSFKAPARLPGVNEWASMINGFWVVAVISILSTT
jgi:hypothetical protein